MGEMNGSIPRWGLEIPRWGLVISQGNDQENIGILAATEICLTGGSPEKSPSPSFTNQILCMDFVVKIGVFSVKELVLAISFAQGAILKNGL